MSATLAQSSGSTAQFIIWVGVLIAASIVGGLIMLAVRRRMLSQDRDELDGSLLDQLRKDLREGKLTQDEYDAIKRRMAQQMAERLGAKGSTPEPDPKPESKPAPAPQTTNPGALTAEPGFDLTGQPLPTRTPQNPPEGGSAEPDEGNRPDRTGGAGGQSV